MNTEIERKFLVDFDLLIAMEPDMIKSGVKIEQGYIAQTEEKTVVRVRLYGDKGYLTIKGKTIGATRPEFEYEIPYEDAKEMLNKFCKKRIKKTRYIVQQSPHKWEIDIFEKENKGLIIAEIELEKEKDYFFVPKWIKEEVTYESNYFNSNLLK